MGCLFKKPFNDPERVARRQKLFLMFCLGCGAVIVVGGVFLLFQLHIL